LVTKTHYLSKVNNKETARKIWAFIISGLGNKMSKTEREKIIEFFKKANIEIEFKDEWREKGNITGLNFIYNNSKLFLYASSNSGCEQCDPDGCNDSTIETW